MLELRVIKNAYFVSLLNVIRTNLLIFVKSRKNKEDLLAILEVWCFPTVTTCPGRFSHGGQIKVIDRKEGLSTEWSYITLLVWYWTVLSFMVTAYPLLRAKCN